MKTRRGAVSAELPSNKIFSNAAKKILILLGLTVVVSACDSIGNGTGSNGVSISAQVTSGNCTNMANNQVCIITITYNTNGVSGATLGYTPNPLPLAITSNGTFNSTFGTCQSQVILATTNKQYTCPVTITYTSGVGGANFDLAFTLSSVTSNSINVSGK